MRRAEALFIMTSEFLSCRQISNWFAAAGIQPRISIEINATDVILVTVKHGSLATIRIECIAAAISGAALHPA